MTKNLNYKKHVCMTKQQHFTSRTSNHNIYYITYFNCDFYKKLINNVSNILLVENTSNKVSLLMISF